VDDIQATLQYHLLNGAFPSVSIPSTPIFVPTALTNQSYSPSDPSRLTSPRS
jgi:hypothetical protein